MMNHTSWIGIVLATAALAAPTGRVTAAEYYVSPNGDNRAAGTIDAPFRNIQRALGAAKQPGDHVVLRAGVYRPQRGEKAIVDGSDTPENANTIAIMTSFVRVEGLEVRNSRGTGIVVWGSGDRVHDVEVVGNKVHDCFNSGIFVGSGPTDPARYVRDVMIEGNTVYQAGLRNKPRPRRLWPYGLGAGPSRRVTLRNNTVSRCYGEGLGFYLADGGVMEANTSFDNFSVNLYLDNATNVRVDGNLIYSTGDPEFFRFKGHPASGILIANENYPNRSNPSKNIVITNNVLIGNQCAFTYGKFQAGGGLRNVLFAHNTAYGSTGAMIRIDDDAGQDNARIVNNVFHQVGRVAMTDLRFNSGQVEFRGNLWSGVRPQPLGRGAGDVNGDPLFLKPGQLTADAYRLNPRSPARRAGVRLNDAPADFTGKPRGPRTDLGAWELR